MLPITKWKISQQKQIQNCRVNGNKDVKTALINKIKEKHLNSSCRVKEIT